MGYSQSTPSGSPYNGGEFLNRFLKKLFIHGVDFTSVVIERYAPPDFRIVFWISFFFFSNSSWYRLFDSESHVNMRSVLGSTSYGWNTWIKITSLSCASHARLAISVLSRVVLI